MHNSYHKSNCTIAKVLLGILSLLAVQINCTYSNYFSIQKQTDAEDVFLLINLEGYPKFREFPFLDNGQCQTERQQPNSDVEEDPGSELVDANGRRFLVFNDDNVSVSLIDLFRGEKYQTKRLNTKTCSQLIDSYIPIPIRYANQSTLDKPIFTVFTDKKINISEFFGELLSYKTKIVSKGDLDNYLREQNFILVAWNRDQAPESEKSADQTLLLKYFNAVFSNNRDSIEFSKLNSTATVQFTGKFNQLEHYVEPVTTGPETTGPDTSEPETTEPETSEPETTEPETTGPDTSEPETTEPETTGPDTSEPETTGQETTGPDTSETDTVQPDQKTRTIIIAVCVAVGILIIVGFVVGIGIVYNKKNGTFVTSRNIYFQEIQEASLP